MKKVVALLALVAFLLPALAANASSLEVVDAVINKMCINKRMMILTQDGGVKVENSGPGLVVTVKFKAAGLARGRVICTVYPLDSEDNTYAYGNNEASNSVAVNIPTANYTTTVEVALPYGWVVNDETNSTHVINLGINLISVYDNAETLKIMALDGSKIKIKDSNMEKDLTGELLGSMFGGSKGGGGLMGDLFGSMLGGTTVTVESDCPACDGTLLCPSCDGLGFFDPKQCRKCAADPGICRKCHGEGTIESKGHIY